MKEKMFILARRNAFALVELLVVIAIRLAADSAFVASHFHGDPAL